MMKLDSLIIPAGYTVEQALRKVMHDDWRSRQEVRSLTNDSIAYEVTLIFKFGVTMGLAREVLDTIESEEAAARGKRTDSATAPAKIGPAQPCRYPACVDDGPDGKCSDWLAGDCKGPGYTR